MVSDEENLIQSLEGYKSQLNVVEESLKKDCSMELLELKDDITELIQLTEESLLALKKRNLLAYLDTTAINDSNIEVEDTSNDLESLPCTESIKDENTDGSDDDLFGMKCRVPYCHGWGEMDYHNAVVFCRESQENMVRVIFCNPTHTSMKLCSYFIEGKCKYHDLQCRLSHGYVVDVSQLLPFQEPNFESMKVGSSCLAKDTDDLWYRGVVIDIYSEKNKNGSHADAIENAMDGNVGKIKVMFDGHHILDLDLHDVFPISDEMKKEDETHNSEDGTNNDDESYVPSCSHNVDSLNIQTTDMLGMWEQHTKGMGSKLMLKMGYVLGEGLGRKKDGRVLPVPISILPVGKSLDIIMEMKNKVKNKNMFQVNADKLHQPSFKTKKRHANLFDILNKNVFCHNQLKKKKQLSSIRTTQQKHISAHDLNKKSDKHINIQLLKTADELKRSNEEMIKLNDSLNRNIRSGDKLMVLKIEKKIQSLISYQEQLRTSEKFMNSHKKSRKADEELSKF